MRILLITTLLFISHVAVGQTCIGGTEDTGKNGHSYCFSNISMNWWAAHQWCQSNKRHLATVWEACDSLPNTLSAYCSNIGGIGTSQHGSSPWSLWTSVSKDISTAYAVSGHHGSLLTGFNFEKSSDRQALCY